MIYGYTRVSTPARDLAPHVAQLKAVGHEKIFHEKMTDTTTERPRLRKLIAMLVSGDEGWGCGCHMGCSPHSERRENEEISPHGGTGGRNGAADSNGRRGLFD
jgi:Resolvase, N terminal domain